MDIELEKLKKLEHALCDAIDILRDWQVEEVKQECPCADGIDSKACAGCPQSDDGKESAIIYHHHKSSYSINGFPIETILKDALEYLPATYMTDNDKKYVVRFIEGLLKRDRQLKELLDDLQAKAIVNYGGGTDYDRYDIVWCDCEPPCGDKYKDCVWRGRTYYNCHKCVDGDIYAPSPDVERVEGIYSRTDNVDLNEKTANTKRIQKAFADAQAVKVSWPYTTTRPFKDCDELIDFWTKHYQTGFRPAHTMPLIWLRRKNEEQRSFVTDFIGGRVRIEDAEYTMAALLDIWTFLDGGPVGMEC